MKITNMDQLRQAASIVQPYVNGMCNATDTETIVKSFEVIKETISAIYIYKLEEIKKNS